MYTYLDPVALDPKLELMDAMPCAMATTEEAVRNHASRTGWWASPVHVDIVVESGTWRRFIAGINIVLLVKGGRTCQPKRFAHGTYARTPAQRV